MDFIDYAKCDYRLYSFYWNNIEYKIIIPIMRKDYLGRPRDVLWKEACELRLSFLDGSLVKLIDKFEIWKDIKPVLYNDVLYLADNDGNAKYECSHYGRLRNKKTLKWASVGDAGEYFDITDKGRKFLIHRLIFRAFVSPNVWKDEYLFDTGYHIDHIDGIKVNNQFANLRAVSPSDNHKNVIDKNIRNQFLFRPPNVSKNPKRQINSKTRMLIVDNKYIVVSLKDLGGLLNGNNTQKYTLSNNGKIYNKFSVDDVPEDMRKAIINTLYSLESTLTEVNKEL